MLDEAILERRLAIIEQEVSELKRKADSKATSSNWIDNLIGSISDESAFLEALEYGRSFRKVDTVIDDSNEET